MKTGNIIELNDFVSLTKNNDQTGKYEPLRLFVERTATIKSELGSIDLVYTKEGKIISILNVDGQKQTLVLTKAEDFPMVNRKLAIEQEMFWLFKQPKDENNIVFNELEFTEDINDDSTGTELKYIKEYSLLGELKEYPTRNGMGDLFGGFTQYVIEEHNKEKGDNFLVLLEIGDILSEDGGLLTINKGYMVKETEIKIL